MSLALGGYGAIAGASAAAATQNTTMPNPTRAGGDSRRRPSRRAHARARPSRTLSGATGRPSTVVGTDTGASGSDPRVEEHVGEIAEDLRPHRHAHGYQRADLDEGDVLEESRLEHHAAEA